MTEIETERGYQPRPDTVFTPGGYPRANFVTREEFQPGKTIQWALRSGAVMQLIGPLDSGKTAFARHLTADRPLLTVRGRDIDDHDDVASQLFDGLVASESKESGISPTLRPSTDRIEEVRDQPRDQLRVVNRALDSGEIAVLYDDFDAIPDDLQRYVAQLLKGQYERGVDLFVTTVPWSSDDLFVANSDLRGRVRSVDVPGWETDELSSIARNGFERLGLSISETTITSLAVRANGSPTEMHRLCSTVATFHDREQRREA